MIVNTIIWSLVIFICGLLALVLSIGVISAIDEILKVIRCNADEAVSIWFKAHQMNQNIRDAAQRREVNRDKAELLLEAGAQELGLSREDRTLARRIRQQRAELAADTKRQKIARGPKREELRLLAKRQEMDLSQEFGKAFISILLREGANKSFWQKITDKVT